MTIKNSRGSNDFKKFHVVHVYLLVRIYNIPFYLLSTQIRSLSRNTRGSVAMRLKDGDRMASMDIIPAALHKDLERTPEDSHSK